MNSMAGKHYRYRLFRDGVKLRNKYMDTIRAAKAAVGLALTNGRGHAYEVVSLPSMRSLVLVQRTRRTQTKIVWHSRRQR